jgi:hypothetical protein
VLADRRSEAAAPARDARWKHDLFLTKDSSD